MAQNATASALSFRKRWFGYDPDEVDAYLAKAVETHEAVRAEVERLQAAEPLARVGGDVANLLTTFAETVSSMRDAAAAEIDRLRAEASGYAEQQRTEADEYAGQQRAEADEYAARQRAQADEALAEARDRARDEANAIVSQARQEMAAIGAQWSAAERCLNDAAGGIATALASMHRVSGLPNGTIDIADHRPADAAAPANADDADDEGGSVLPSLAAKMWQSRQSQAAGSGARLQYLLPRLRSNPSDD
jgi:DivIVA domain-containing protein